MNANLLRRLARVRARHLAVGVLGAALLLPAPAGAVTTRVWRNATASDFSAGRLDKAMISSLGVVSSGFDVLRQGVPVGLVWSVAEGPDGTVYVGTGNSGEIFALRGTRLVRYAKLDAVVVTSLVVAQTPNGLRLYAGTLPEGKIFEVTLGGATGQARELCKLSAAHVWALHYDRAGKRLYAGTGPEGKLFAIEASGKNRVVYDSGEKHVLGLAAGRDGALYLAMAERGLVLRFDPKSGRTRAVHDFETDEVRAVVARGDTLFVAVNKFDRSRTVPPLSPSSPTSFRTRPVAIGGARSSRTSGSSSSTPKPRKGKGWVFRIDPDGRTERLLYLRDTYVSALDVDGQGNVYAGTGSKGRVIMVRPDRTIFTAFELRERQVLALSMGRTPIIGTSDAGAVYRVLGRLPKSARYTSKVFDAGFHARWGNLMWRGSGTLAFETRSGNTSEPDKTWSPWQKLGVRPPSRVPSPPGRYLQYRVRWDRDRDARLREVQLYYLPQNQRPRVTSMQIVPAPPKNKGDDRPLGHLKITWNVDNPDGDKLVYRVFYRAEGEQNWKLLTRPDPLTKAEYIWNTQSVPHGQYRVKITASDERSNPPGAALIHERISPPLLVDNGKPVLADLRVRYPQVTGRARDGQSRISRIEYAVDGGEWVFIHPRDGIFDDQDEPFSIRIGERLTPGQHSIAIRAWDAAGNLGASQVTFTVR